jgi:hypothetical protein
MSYGQLFSVHFIHYKQGTPNGVFALQQQATPTLSTTTSNASEGFAKTPPNH